MPFLNILHGFRFAVKMVDPGVFALAQSFDVAHGRHDEPI